MTRFGDPRSRGSRRVISWLFLLAAAGYVLLRLGVLDPGPAQRYEGQQSSPPAPGAQGSAPAELTRGSWRARLKHVIDGDSFYLETLEGREVEVRLVGINAPEMDTPAGPPAREYCRRLLESASTITVEPEPSGPVDKHGRVLAWVWLEFAEVNRGERMLLNEAMVRDAGVPLFKYAGPEMRYYEQLSEARGTH